MSSNYSKSWLDENIRNNKALDEIEKLNDSFNKDKQLYDKPLRDVIEKYFDNNWEQYFKDIEEIFRLRAELEIKNCDLDFDYSDCFTLNYVIYAVRHEIHYSISKYIDEKQIVENWIIINKIPDEYKHYVWEIYNNYISDDIDDE